MQILSHLNEDYLAHQVKWLNITNTFELQQFTKRIRPGFVLKDCNGKLESIGTINSNLCTILITDVNFQVSLSKF